MIICWSRIMCKVSLSWKTRININIYIYYDVHIDIIYPQDIPVNPPPPWPPHRPRRARGVSPRSWSRRTARAALRCPESLMYRQARPSWWPPKRMRITTWLGIGDGNGICIWMYLVYVITSGIYIYYKLVGNGWLIMIDIGYIYI